MAKSTVPQSVESGGNFKVWALPYTPETSLTTVTVAELKAENDVTYSFTTSGFDSDGSQEEVTDDRLTLRDVLSRPGKVTNTLQLQYVFGSDDKVQADKIFVQGMKYKLVVRWSIDNEVAPAASQLVDIHPIEIGFVKKDAPTANGRQTKSPKTFYIGPVVQDVKLSE